MAPGPPLKSRFIFSLWGKPEANSGFFPEHRGPHTVKHTAALTCQKDCLEKFSIVSLQAVHRAAIWTEGKQYVDHRVPAASLEQSKKNPLTNSKSIFGQMNLQLVHCPFGNVS